MQTDPVQSELKGDFVATLVLQKDYKKNVGQVAAVSTEELRYIRPQTLARTPFETEALSLDGCRYIRYKSDWALPRIFLGVLSFVLAFGIIGATLEFGVYDSGRPGGAASRSPSDCWSTTAGST